MTTCYRCGETIQEATTLEGPKGACDYYNCAEKEPEPVVEAPPEPKVITKYITLDPVVVTKVVAVLDRRKAAIYAGAGVVLGGLIGAAVRVFV